LRENTHFEMDDGDYGESAQNEDILTQEKTAEARRFGRATTHNFIFVHVSRTVSPSPCMRAMSHTRAPCSAFALFEKDGQVSRDDIGQVKLPTAAIPSAACPPYELFFSNFLPRATFPRATLSQVLRAIGVNPTEVPPPPPVPIVIFCSSSVPLLPLFSLHVSHCCSSQAELSEFKDPSVQGGGTVNFDELLQLYA
jgi:hypothetical protein